MQQENGKKVARNMNMDLLRIVSMLLIVLLHSIDHSGVLEKAINCESVIDIYVMYVYAFTRVCVNCYVLLSGYFLVKSKFRLHKLIALWMEVVFYSFVIKLIFMLTGQITFSIVSLASCFFPILTGRYWFVTIYFALYLIAPFLNKAIYAMDKREFTMFNIVLGVLFSVWSSIHPAIAGVNSGGGWGLAWFVVLYFAAAWFRLYYVPCYRYIGKIVLVFLMPVITIVIFIVGGVLKSGILQQIGNQWCRYDSLPVYFASVMLFVVFINVKIENERVKKIISIVSPATFGVYMIHAHAEVDPWLWGMLDLPQKMENMAFPAVQLLSVLVIFVICIGIDIVRQKTLGRIEKSDVVKQVSNRVETLIKTLFLKLFNVLNRSTHENISN